MAPRAATPARATPARSTRARSQIGLNAPPIPLGISTAYGSPGRPVLQRPNNSSLANNLSAAEALRQAQQDERKSVAPESDQEAPQPAVRRRPAAREREVRRAPAKTASLEDFDRPMSSASLQHEGTSIAPLAHYESRPLAGGPSPHPQTPSLQPSDENIRKAARPWNFTVLMHSLPEYAARAPSAIANFIRTKWHLLVILLLIGSTITSLVEPYQLPRRWAGPRSRIMRIARLVSGMDEYEGEPSHYESTWHFYRHRFAFSSEEIRNHTTPKMQWAVNINLLQRIEKLETRTDKLEESVSVLTHQISRVLPQITVVQIEDGEFVIPDGFWIALQQKMTGNGDLWEAFHNANEAKLNQYTQRVIGDRLALGEKQSTVVGREMLEDIIRDNYNDFLKEFRSNMDGERNVLTDEVRKIASRVAEDLIARHTAGQIPLEKQAGNRLGSDYIQNNLDELHSVNFFSPYHGAQIDYQFTSPTGLRKQPSLLAKLFKRFGENPNMPHTALRSWNEVTESWCAAHSTNKPGSSMLGIRTQQAISPEQLVIEHIPASGTLEIANAPREVELWMHVGSEEQVKQIQEAMESEIPHWKHLDCAEPPGPGYVCAAKGMYDIHNENWVQAIPALRFFYDFQVKSQRFVIRSQTNWGGLNTCWYRIRLNGTP